MTFNYCSLYCNRNQLLTTPSTHTHNIQYNKLIYIQPNPFDVKSYISMFHQIIITKEQNNDNKTKSVQQLRQMDVLASQLWNTMIPIIINQLREIDSPTLNVINLFPIDFVLLDIYMVIGQRVGPPGLPPKTTRVVQMDIANLSSNSVSMIQGLHNLN